MLEYIIKVYMLDYCGAYSYRIVRIDYKEDRTEVYIREYLSTNPFKLTVRFENNGVQIYDCYDDLICEWKFIGHRKDME